MKKHNNLKAHGLHLWGNKIQYLDTVAAAHSERLYPIIFCRMEFDRTPDLLRLEAAVQKTALIVPEILQGYDSRKGKFVERGFTVRDVIKEDEKRFPGRWRWDLEREPQLRIRLCHEENRNTVIFGISHILCDGKGFLQYLYLLAAVYNGREPSGCFKNRRSMMPLSQDQGFCRSRKTDQEKYVRNKPPSPLFTAEDGRLYGCRTAELDTAVMKQMRVKAKKKGVTVNDIFLTAYSRAALSSGSMSASEETARFVIPCPADLRRFYSTSDTLTIANMTGLYLIPVEIPKNSTFDDLLRQIHIEMTLQKGRRRCFSGLKRLKSAARLLPLPILKCMIRTVYPPFAVSYSNVGVIDEEKLHFAGCDLRKCCLTGTYRKPPDFQLFISTFKGRCTLSCSLLGGRERLEKGSGILTRVKQELELWLCEES